MTGNSPSTDRPAPGAQLCVWCKQPRESHTPSCPSPPVFLDEKVVVHSLVYKAGPEPETPAAALAAGSSSSIHCGAGASRSWSVTGSSGLVCRRLRQARSEGSLVPAILRRGTGIGSRSGSLKSYSAAASATGTVARTPANDCWFGQKGMHFWVKDSEEPDYIYCSNCGRRRP